MAYTQKQRFNPTWIIASLLFSLAIVVGTAYRQGDLLSVPVIAVTGFMLLLHGALLASRLHLIVNEEGIRYRFFPFHLKPYRIYWYEVKEAKLNSFNALSEFGGWGIRYNFFWGTKAFIARSGTGLFLSLEDGRKRMFSISKPRQLEAWIPQVTDIQH